MNFMKNLKILYKISYPITEQSKGQPKNSVTTTFCPVSGYQPLGLIRNMIQNFIKRYTAEKFYI